MGDISSASAAAGCPLSVIRGLFTLSHLGPIRQPHAYRRGPSHRPTAIVMTYQERNPIPVLAAERLHEDGRNVVARRRTGHRSTRKRRGPRKPIGPGGWVVILAIFVISGIASLFNHGGSVQPSTTDDYSTVAPAPTYDVPPVDTATYDSPPTDLVAPTQDYTGGDTGSGTVGGSGDSGGVDIDPPGHPYVDGPGVDCHLSGCHVHGPHIGWHW